MRPLKSLWSRVNASSFTSQNSLLPVGKNQPIRKLKAPSPGPAARAGSAATRTRTAENATIPAVRFIDASCRTRGGCRTEFNARATPREKKKGPESPALPRRLSPCGDAKTSALDGHVGSGLEPQDERSARRELDVLALRGHGGTRSGGGSDRGPDDRALGLVVLGEEAAEERAAHRRAGDRAGVLAGLALCLLLDRGVDDDRLTVELDRV